MLSNTKDRLIADQIAEATYGTEYTKVTKEMTYILSAVILVRNKMNMEEQGFSRANPQKKRGISDNHDDHRAWVS
jgi:hypothetical protein